MGAAPNIDLTQRTAHTDAIRKLSKSVESLIGCWDGFKDLNEEGLYSLDAKREAARNACKEEMENLEHTRKRKAQELDLDFINFQREKVIKILEETNEIPIKRDELAELQSKIANVEEKQKQAVEAAEKTLKQSLTTQAHFEKERMTMAHESILMQIREQNKAEKAVLTETNKALEQQLHGREETVKNLREDVKAAQELVKNVAEASRPQVTYSGSDESGQRKRFS